MRFYTQSERNSLSTLDEVIAFEQIQSEQTALFNAWIESNSSLLSFLQGNVTTPFKDSSMLLKNALLPDFKRYTAHFLPEFQPREDDFWGALTDYISYFCVVDATAVKTTLPFISSQVTRQNDLEFSLNVTSPDSFNQAIHAFFATGKISAYSMFPKEWEVLRIQFVEQSLRLIQNTHCSPTSAGFILSKLRLIELPEEVKQSVNEAWNGFQKGQLNIQKKEQKKLKISRPLMVRLALGAVGILSCFFLFNWVFSVEEAVLAVTPNSSLTYFTPRERIYIDTTLRSGKPIRSTVLLSSSSSGVNYQIRQAFVNKKAEALYTSLTNGLNDHYYNPKPLGDSTTDNTVEGTTSLAEFNGKSTIKCKNSSAYDVLIIAFSELTESPVYSTLIRSGATQTYQLTKGSQVLFLPGKQFSGSNKIPFNVWDYNFDQAIQQVYTFNGGLSFAVVFRGDWGEEFSFTNPYQCFKQNP
jgi:hypothetical protein